MTSPAGFDQSWIDDYHARWHAKNPLVHAMADHVIAKPIMQRDTPVLASQCLGVGSFRELQIYKELYRPSDLADHLALPIHIKTELTGIGMWASHKRGEFTDEDYKAGHLISRHLMRAKDIADKLRYAQAFSQAENLKVFSEPAMIIDQFGRLIESNGAADALFEKQTITLQSDRRLYFRDCAANDAFYGELSQIKPSLKDPVALHRVASFSAGADVNAVLYGLPLCSLSKLTTRAYREYLLCLSQQIKLGDHVVGVIAARYGLTKTERKIAAMMVDGLSVTDIAQGRNTKVSTTRWHVKRLFQKFDVSNQRELIRKILLQ